MPPPPCSLACMRIAPPLPCAPLLPSSPPTLRVAPASSTATTTAAVVLRVRTFLVRSSTWCHMTPVARGRAHASKPLDEHEQLRQHHHAHQQQEKRALAEQPHQHAPAVTAVRLAATSTFARCAPSSCCRTTVRTLQPVRPGAVTTEITMLNSPPTTFSTCVPPAATA
jgi:hypothetical protein